MIHGDSPNPPVPNNRKRSNTSSSEEQESQSEGKRVKRSETRPKTGKNKARARKAVSLRTRKTRIVSQVPSSEIMESSSTTSSEQEGPATSAGATQKIREGRVCMFSSISCFADLQYLSRRLTISTRVESGISELIPHDPDLPEAEKPKGVFAKRPFNKDEIIGVYLGQIVRRKKLTGALKKYLPASMVDKYDGAYFVWHEAGHRSTSRYNDSHTAWTGVKLMGTGIELGVDGLKGGNDLRYLNHSPNPNTQVRTIVNEDHLADTPQAEARMLLDPQKSGDDSLLTVVIAGQDIKEDEELTMHYQDVPLKADDPFAHVGKNILGDLPEGASIETLGLAFGSEQGVQGPSARASHLQALQNRFDQDMQKALLSAIQGDRAALKQLKAQANETARTNSADNQALDAFFLAHLIRNSFARKAFLTIYRRITANSEHKLAGREWTSSADIYDYFILRGLLSKELSLLLLPGVHPSLKNDSIKVEQFIVTLYHHGYCNATLIAEMSQTKAAKPAYLDSKNEEGWSRRDFSQILHHNQCLADIDDNAIQVMLNQVNGKERKANSQHWITLTSLCETRPEAFCLFIEDMMNREEQGADKNTKTDTDKKPPRGSYYSDIGSKLPTLHLNIQLDGEPFKPDINGAPYYLLMFGNARQKRRALEFIQGRAAYLTKALPNNVKAGYLRIMLMHPMMDYVEKEWPGYPEYLKKRYLAYCLKPDVEGKTSGSAYKIARFIKREEFVADFAEWTFKDFAKKQQEVKAWCEEHEQRFSRLPAQYARS